MGHFNPDLDGHLRVLPPLQTGSGCPGAATKLGRLISIRESLNSWAPVRAASQGDAMYTFPLFFLAELHRRQVALKFP